MMNNSNSIAVQGRPEESLNRLQGLKQTQRLPLQQVQNIRAEQKVIKKEDIPRQVRSAPKEVKQVEVECVAPYDEHKWVSIGKEKDGMRPQDVQYAQALQPPYHLASLLNCWNSTRYQRH
eukprot:TRINITY_DN27314_c0_g1_i1.p1 TRINITY_DN27314_c0_g1~~TRINITY_DN27314_c0_g1_i1.p1  ORF type:complete len:120 (-),score=25.71 TRINITY_DN27314_c0_g1_i1:36-395(-)